MEWRLTIQFRRKLTNCILKGALQKVCQVWKSSFFILSSWNLEIVGSRFSSTGLEKLPSKVYLNVMLSGAKENNFPVDYIQKLEEMENNGYIGEVDVELPLNVIS